MPASSGVLPYSAGKGYGHVRHALGTGGKGVPPLRLPREGRFRTGFRAAHPSASQPRRAARPAHSPVGLSGQQGHLRSLQEGHALAHARSATMDNRVPAALWF